MIGAASGPGPDVFAAALAALPDGVALFDADWTICWINASGAALLGRPSGELTDRNL